MAVRSPNFDEKLFWKWARHYREGPNLDFKRDWVNMLVDDRKLANLVRHVIAMANVAYRTRQPGKIVFGVTDKTREIYDLTDKFPNDRGNQLRDPISVPTKMEDYVLEEFRKNLEEWVSPELPELKMEYGEIIDQDILKLVAWIKILPGNDYCYLNKSINTGRHNFRRGQTFIRKGSSSIPISRDQLDQYSSELLVPYLDSEKWSSIINLCYSGEFSEAVNVYPFMPHRLVGKDRLAEQVILDSLFMGQKLILVRGPAGVGKSLLLKRLAYALADRNFDSDNNLVISRHRYGGEFPTEYESVTTTDFPDKDFDDDDFEHEIESIIDELEPLPSSPVPIFYSLRMDFENIGEIEKLIGNSIYSLIYPDDNSRRYSKLINAGNILKGLFSIPGSKWVLLLDALDEVFHPEQNIPKIRTWLSQFPDNVQIIITLRPGINIVEKREEIFDIDTLGKQEILDLLKLRIEVSCEEKNIPKTRMKDEFDVVINWLENNRDIYEILKLNRALLAFSELITGRWDAYKPKIDAAPIKIEAYSYFSSEDISNEKNFPVSTANDVDIPAGTIFDGEITDIEKGVFEEASYVDIEPVFPVALALRQITTTMRHEERKRKPWVPNVDQHDDNARVELERSAWYSNWDVDYVNIEELRKDNNLQYLDWNKNLGFIYSKTPYQLGFINHLYKLYSTAEYACNCEVQTEISAMNRIAAVKVRELLDDLINL